MEKLFAYASLKNEDHQKDLFGRILIGTHETLVGYMLKEIQIEEEFGLVQYPIITATHKPEDTISGIVYDITKQELNQVDLYEGLHYKRIEVQLQSNQKAWAYSAAF
ncbi:Gamma-glutamyl cyclotransferase, AIG2-like [Flavobacterium segetis]|uniref:Gamma-glutamyl cyclotransferase, AIG2-like n=1 Tax=Flavobacterium segetis TaxID=271157 RepID=A0A1M5DZI0_9FLAO|nr:gamma-glutamylcyclotransferase family protein [Flavobacterium segetis]SHF72383.1 Gamma-glutamyl cyclotransferase, AIG2-like [Flavobacterium segetis]